MDFFTNYNQLCKAAGKSANGVAKELGVASGSVTQWKRGSTPRPATIEMIADYFGVTPEELLFGIKKEPSIPKDEELDKNDAISNVSALMNAIEGTDLTVQELIRIAEMFKRMSPADRKFVTGIFEAYTEAK